MWPGGNKGSRGFGAFAPKQGAQEGTGIAPSRTAPWPPTSIVDARDPPYIAYGIVKLPRPTPHPYSGAQDGAVRPVIFCSIASREHSGYWITLVRPWTANDGTLRQREWGERRKKEEDSKAKNKCLREKRGCAKWSRNLGNKQERVRKYSKRIQRERWFRWGRKTGVS